MATKSKGIQHFRVAAQSLSPMLQNPMLNSVLDELLGSKSARKAAETDISVTDRAKQKLCLGPNSEFGFPANYLFASLVDAGRFVQYAGKKNISTREESLVPAFLSILPDLVREDGEGFIPFLDQTVMWIADKRRGVNATTKGANAIVRPKFPTWAFEVTIQVDLDQIGVDKIQSLFEVSGRQCGIGDFRPSRRGPFGRFSVTDFVEWEQSVDQKRAA